MKIEIDGELYNIEIIKKATNKNTYMRVRDDLTIRVTSNIFISDMKIMDIIFKNKKSIVRMINKVKEKNNKKSDDKFYYLGKAYDVVYLDVKDIVFGDERVFLNKKFNLEKWYKKEALIIFKAELDRIYKIYPHNIPYPTLAVRNMKTRWGVCNTKLKKVTLNLSLIKMDIKYLDYVIVHELSHLIEANHSKAFWSLVEECMPDYKKIRKELKDE